MEYKKTMAESLRQRRADQAVLWMWRILEDSLLSHFKKDLHIRSHILKLEDSVRRSKTPPSSAATWLLGTYLDNISKHQHPPKL